MDLIVRADVRAALADNRSVVALESSVIAHGLPSLTNLRVAHSLEEAVLAAGATPATVGVIGGRVRVGLEPEEIERLGGAGEVLKCAAGDPGWAIATGADGATTVSATVFAATRGRSQDHRTARAHDHPTWPGHGAVTDHIAIADHRGPPNGTNLYDRGQDARPSDRVRHRPLRSPTTCLHQPIPRQPEPNHAAQSPDDTANFIRGIEPDPQHHSADGHHNDTHGDPHNPPTTRHTNIIDPQPHPVTTHPTTPAPQRHPPARRQTVKAAGNALSCR
ncbi:MAG: pseudouridine-5'-phosphate glycosidase [Pseudonocardiaceae bacterium]